MEVIIKVYLENFEHSVGVRKGGYSRPGVAQPDQQTIGPIKKTHRTVILIGGTWGHPFIKEKKGGYGGLPSLDFTGLTRSRKFIRQDQGGERARLPELVSLSKTKKRGGGWNLYHAAAKYLI